MRLTEIGTAASYAEAGAATSCHLVQEADTNLVLDLGHGALGALGHFLDPLDITAVVVTHEHVDHFADVWALQAALTYAPEGRKPPLPLYGPPGLVRRMQSIMSAQGACDLEEQMLFTPITPGDEVTIGALAVTALPTRHMADSMGLRVCAADGSAGTLGYTSDTSAGPGAEAIARGADVLLAEATLPGAYEGRVPHLSPAQCARLARDAGVRTLVLTHLWPTADRAQLLAEARAAWDGDIRLAEQGLVIDPV
jgi:ribonuclease BN (tRNA processing enzyme)